MNTTIKYKYSIIFLDGGKKKTRKVTASNIEHALSILNTNWACVIEWEELEEVNQRFEIPKIENPCSSIEMYEKPIDCSLLPPTENPLLAPIVYNSSDHLYFGKKHYGKLISNIIISDPTYILWMNREIKTHKFLDHVINEARKQIINNKTNSSLFSPNEYAINYDDNDEYERTDFEYGYMYD